MQKEIAAKNCILTPEAVHQKLRRMAYQIAEQNLEEKGLVIAGITGNGDVIAKKLVKELALVANLQVQLTSILLNKKDPVDARLRDGIDTTNKVILVVDDVSNTGRTLLYALKPFLSSHPKKIQTLVLVERSHKLFAVQPDFVGLSVSTTLQEHISVETTGEEISGAWLH